MREEYCLTEDDSTLTYASAPMKINLTL